MAKDKQEEAAPKTVQVELLHPIHHDGTIFGRGLHDLEEGLAKLFLSFKDPVSKKPIARIPEVKEPVKGSVEKERK